MSSPTENTLVLFIPVLELNMPEYINELDLIEASGKSSTKKALTP
tara:strand:- start:873 stop:1007 length:135 start_codon:yes stop_codon:yes gene_type:complete